VFAAGSVVFLHDQEVGTRGKRLSAETSHFDWGGHTNVQDHLQKVWIIIILLSIILVWNTVYDGQSITFGLCCLRR